MKRIVFILVLFVLISFGTIALNSCSEADGSSKSDEVNKSTTNEKITNVQILKVEGQEFSDFISIVGTVKAKDEADLSVEEGGIIQKFVKDKGEYVSKDETILILDNKIMKANLDAAKAQYDLAEISFQKQETIFKDNVNSEWQMLQAKYERDAAKANYELMQARYEKTFIKAPFSGIIDTKYIEEGELAAPMSPVVRVINSNSLKIEAGVPERYVNQIQKNGNVKIRIREINEEEIPAKISYVGTSVNNTNRTFPIEIQINKNGYNLKPNMNTEILVSMKKLEDVFVIPEEVITKTDLGDVVYIANNGTADMKAVDVISRYNNKAAVKGLSSGEQLIVVGYQNLVKGEKINVVN